MTDIMLFEPQGSRTDSNGTWHPPQKLTRIRKKREYTGSYSRNDYTVGWISPSEIEQVAALEMLDMQHPQLPQPMTDSNSYTLGQIGHYNVVIAGLPTAGNCSAASVIVHMRRTFPCLRFSLLVGTGGGVPTTTVAGPIRLGDVVVSKPTGQHSGVIQYDHGKAEADGFRLTGCLAPPPNVLLNAAQQLSVTIARVSKDPLLDYTDRLGNRLRLYRYPGRDEDHLYQADYVHADRTLSCQKCGCDTDKLVQRTNYGSDEEQNHSEADESRITIHRGTIATSEKVMRDGIQRDKLAEQYDVLCFETEAAGAVNDFPCLVIRGISDYADSHKNAISRWNYYAAATASSYARQLIYHLPIDELNVSADDKQSLSENRRLNLNHEQTGSLFGASEINALLDKLPWADGATYDAFEDSQDLFELCLEDTRVELLRDVRAWINDSKGRSLFWLNGMAGTGKSTISRTLAKELHAQNLLGASFFFKEGEGDRGNAKRLFTTVTAQLIKSLPALIPQVTKALNEDAHIGSRTMREQFDKLIFEPFKAIDGQADSPPIVIVIDALDECKPTFHIEMLLSLFSRLKDLRQAHVRTFVTSRPERELRSGFYQLTTSVYQDILLHEIPKEIVTHDIGLYLHYRFNQIRIRHMEYLPSNWPGEQILAQLTQMASPLFIFAATVSRFIGDINHDPESRLQSVLADQDDQAYDKVHKTYRPILDRLIEESTVLEQPEILKSFRLIVGCIVILYQPLSVRGLANLLVLPVRKVTVALSGLHSVLHIPQDQSLPVRTLHLSFANFLLDKKRHHEHRFWIDAKQVHTDIASKCLNCLNSADSLAKRDICNLQDSGFLRESIDPKLLGHLSPEVRYACRYWLAHLKESNSNIEIFESHLHVFLTQRFLIWFEAMGLLGWVSEAVIIMNDLFVMLQNDRHSKLGTIVYDARRFVLANSHIVGVAPLQLYSSCAIFAPRSSITRANFPISSTIRALSHVADHWSPILQTLEGHTQQVRVVAFSPNDGRYLASGCDQGTIRIWDVSSGLLQHVLEKHDDVARSLCLWYSEGRLLVCCNNRGSIRIWDATLGRPYGVLEGEIECIRSVAVCNEGALLASGSLYGDIEVFDLASGQREYLVSEHRAEIASLAFSFGKEKLLASGSKDTNVNIWDPKTGELQRSLHGHSGLVSSLAFSPTNPNLLVTGSWDNTIKLWEATTGNLRYTIQDGYRGIMSVAISPDGRFIASGSADKKLKLWDMITGDLHNSLEGANAEINSVAFSPDGNLLACGLLGSSGTVKLWDISSEQLWTQENEKHADEVKAVALTSDGDLIASCSFDDTLKLWSITDSQLKIRQSEDLPDTAYSLAFSPCNKLLASGMWNHTIMLWDVETGHLRLKQTLTGHAEAVNSLIFSNDGTLLVSASVDGFTKFWDCNPEFTERSGSGFTRSAASSCMTISQDNKLLAQVINHGKLICLWDISMSQLLQEIKVGCELKWIRFDEKLPQLNTNQGSFNLLRSIDFVLMQQTESVAFTIEDDWLVKHGRRILWLPSEYRGRALAQAKDYVVLGCYSGRVTLLDLSAG